MNNPVYDLLRADGSIVINKRLAHGIGLNESIVFGELLSRYYYFKERGQLQSDGSFFNTINDLMLGTSLHERAQRTAITNLKKKDLIKVKVKGIPPKRYFKINDDVSVITKYLADGSEKVEELKKKYDEKRIPAFAVFESCGGVELNPAESVCNNTNPNNSKEIKKRYVNLEINGPCNFLKYYLLRLKENTGNDHKPVSEENYYFIENAIETIKGYFDIEEWWEEVDDHLENLPANNDGSIMPFLRASARRFDIRLTEGGNEL